MRSDLPAAETRLSPARLAFFSMIGAPVAAAAVPMGVYVPALYAQALGFSLTTLGLVFLFGRLWDALTDPLIGTLSDHSRTRWGRRRPWIAGGGVLFALAVLSIFFPGATMSLPRLVVSLFFFYLGWTMIQIPFLAWSGEMSRRYHERTRIAGYQISVSSVAFLVILIVPTLVDQLSAGNGRLKLAAMGGALLLMLIPSLLFGLRLFREPPLLPMPPRQPFLQALGVLAGDRLLRRVLLSDFAVTLAQFIRGALFVFFVTDYMGMRRLASLLFLLQFVFGVGAAPLWMAIGRRIGKHRAAVAGETLQLVINLLLLFSTPDRVWLVAALTVAQGLAQGSGNLMLRAIVADLADKHRLETGTDRTGLMFSVFSLSSKAATAVAVGITLPLVAWLGFNPHGANTPHALHGLLLVFALGPALAHSVSALAIRGFPLDEAGHDRIRTALAGRSSSRSAAPSPEEVVMSLSIETSRPDAGTRSRIEVVPVAGRIGAELRGIDLSQAIAAVDVAAIRAALLRHKVIFFRGQAGLGDAGQERLAEALGELVVHPTVPKVAGSRAVLDLDERAGYGASSWHTDVTFVPAYPLASILRALVVPAAGGDTMWANTAAAYEDLPLPLRRMADELRAVHSNDYELEPGLPFPGGEADAAEMRRIFAARIFEAEHPVVRVHPETGERSLVLGHFLKRFVGFGGPDSRRLYELFQEHVTRPENTVRWRWQVGDIAIWDNRATQHRAVADFGSQPRNLRRVTVAGDVPLGVDGRPSRVIRSGEAASA